LKIITTTIMASLETSGLFDVKGLVAVITGGGTGIGLMMAKALEHNGATVYIIGRRLEVLEKAAKENSLYSKIIPLQGDVTSKDSLLHVVSTIKSQTGYINLLVNNSGIAGPSTAAPLDTSQSVKQFAEFFWNEASMEDFTKLFEVNVTGVFYTTLAFLELLDAGNKEGHGLEGVSSQVVTVSSIGGFRRDKDITSFAYQASKAAVTHLGKILASVLTQWNIRSNLIAPGLFPSEMSLIMKEIKDGKLPAERVPMRRPGTEKDIGGLILYLASKAGAYVNGNVSLVDGGRLSLFCSTY